MMMISVMIASVVLPILGMYIDKSPAIKIVPYAFLSRCICTYFFSMLQSPNSYEAYAVCVLIIISTILESNLVDSIFAKNVNKATRAMFFGMQMFLCNCAMLAYSLSAGYLFDHVGPRSPFVLIGAMDFLYAILVGYQTYKHGWQ
jgi:MFS family permease